MRFFSLAVSALLLGVMATPALCQVTRQECEDQGGQVVGDIGNGAIFQPGYVCEVDGNPPTDVILAAPGEPIAIEGEVCCGGTGKGIGEPSGGSGDGSTSAENGTEEDGGRPEMSVDDCAAMDGVLVYDIGDGAIHRDDYICELSGLPPLGTVIARAGEPMPREGQVCCASSAEMNPDDGLSLPGNNATDREEFTREECLDFNGTIVGDIGDGAIFDVNYVCESDGLPPVANIVQNEPPFAIEGEVCCGEGIPIMETERDEISRQECEAQGGLIVADIGDGSTRDEDYVCESNGEPPIANIVPLEGEPIADEGEVCCGEGIPIMETDRDEVSRQECEAQGGLIVGDIGDGSTRRVDYVCESNGQPPIANIVPVEGEPIAFEGEVCCGTGAPIIETTRDEVTRQECVEQGGEIVGDIGDGATQADDYICENNGMPPIANVIAAEGEPIASEGEVCCGSDSLEGSTSGLLEDNTDGASLLSMANALGALIFLCIVNLM